MKNKIPKCPCGGGQSCIVLRRFFKDWVHEDDIFKKNKLSLRKDCLSKYTEKQKKCLFKKPIFKSIKYRWKMDK